MNSVYDNRVPLSRIQCLDDISANLKRNILISHQRLPKDFFPSRNSLKRQSTITRDRGNLLSQNIRRNFSNIDNLYTVSRRESMTARQNRVQNQEDLILGIISASKQMKRVIRKHSLQIRKKQNKVIEINPHLSKKSLLQRGVQLPPLLLKKGVTAAF